MSKKVSADTIQDLTITYGFSPGSTTPPTTQQMIDNIRTNLSTQIKILSEQATLAKAADPNAPPSAFAISCQYLQRTLQDFEEILSIVPKGFRLTPVLYSKIDNAAHDRVSGEFDDVRKSFLNFLATRHADELRTLGIGEDGINSMKQGRQPVAPNGQPYHVNIDHIIERSGAGNLALRKAPDPMAPPGSPPTFFVNHFNNFIFLPEQIHEFKNALNKIQNASQTPYGKSQWILMLIPEASPSRSGFVAIPQDPQHPLQGVFPRNQYPFKGGWAPASYRAVVAIKSLGAFMTDSTVAKLVQEEESLKTPEAKASLRATFNKAVHGNEATRKTLQTLVEPAMQSLVFTLRDMFDRAVAPGKDPKQYQTFLRVYHSQDVMSARKIIAHFPVDEMIRAHQALQDIDKQIQARAPRYTEPPVNDNRNNNSRNNDRRNKTKNKPRKKPKHASHHPKWR